MEHRWVGPTLVATAGVATTIGMGRFAVSLLLPGMRDSLDFSDTATGVLAAGSMVGFLGGAVGFASRAARIGESLLLAVGAGIAASGFAAIALAPAYVAALIGMLVGGIGTGIATVAGAALVIAVAPVARRGVALGVANTGAGAGLVGVGILAPMFDGPGQWRIAWMVIAFFTVVVSAAAWIVGGGSGGSATRRLRSPKVREVWGLHLVYAGFGFGLACYATYFGSFIVDEQGHSAELAGWAWRLLGLVSIVSGLFWGRISDRWTRSATLSMILAVQAAGFVVLLPGSVNSTFASSLLVGATAFVIPGMVAAAAADVVGPARASSLYGATIVFSSIGQASGPPLAGALTEVVGSYRPAFVIAALAAGLTSVVAPLVLRVGVHPRAAVFLAET